MFRELQGKNKSLLSRIFIASDDLNQYRHNDLLFEFSCSNRRAINSLQMSVVLPAGAIPGDERAGSSDFVNCGGAVAAS
jgi:hypothetical protein